MKEKKNNQNNSVTSFWLIANFSIWKTAAARPAHQQAREGAKERVHQGGGCERVREWEREWEGEHSWQVRQAEVQNEAQTRMPSGIPNHLQVGK